MTRVNIFCEGQTEEAFVRELLTPHFASMNIWITYIIVRTSRAGKGGIPSYGKIKNQVKKKCKEDKNSWVTTLFDFYAFPWRDISPPIDTKGDSFSRAGSIETAFKDDINQPNFIPNLVVHELEGLLFSNPSAFNDWFNVEAGMELTAIRNDFATPEHINNSSKTAPSKRILALCPGYEKAWHGPLIAVEIGLDTIRRECPRFDGWIKRLEALAKNTTPPPGNSPR
ncbi:MAG: DUF4276 family protein [Magnetococcales bacterium]|nr:DUF4276 family protein [Magnetococcales bacterium]